MHGFFVHQSHRVELLAGMLAERIAAAPPPDPMTPITVVVGSRGMERWLRHRLAEHLGACANVAFRFPSAVLDEVLGHSLGDSSDVAEGWSVEALPFSVLAALDEVRALLPPAFDTAGPIDRRRFGFAREMASVIDRYVHQRPDWVAAWTEGRTVLDLEGEPFQAALFRALVARLGPHHLAARAARFLALEAPASPFPSLHLFGLSSLPRLHLEILSRLGGESRVDLYAFCPSDLYWGDLRSRRDLVRIATEDRDQVGARLRAELSRQNPLLTGLGRLSRDFQLVLEDVGGHREGKVAFPRAPDATVLGALQADVLDLRAPGELARSRVVGDDSLSVHACVGPLRQVEALREALLALFEDHRHLEPRDVLVMTPDIERYAPLVRAVLEDGERAPPYRRGPAIPVEIVDRSLTRQNPFADALRQTLDLARGRLHASEVMDLLALPPVCERFGLAPEELADVRELVRGSGIRWGLDAEDRAREGQPDDRAFTFAFGLDRLALGVTSADDGEWLFEGLAPFDAIEGERALRFGALAAFVAALEEARARLRAPRTMHAWVTALGETLDTLTAARPETAWLRERVLEELGLLDAASTGLETELTLDALALVLEGSFDVPRGGDRPITGAVTVCALAPMRSVPFKVIALLGLDDDAGFPRARAAQGFDLLPKKPRIGDRDPRDEDRHLLLEAILSTRAHFLVFYSGRDEHSGERRPPAVPIAELLDAVEATFPGAAGARSAVLFEEPLQPFAVESFAAPARSFDARMREAALVLASPRDTARAAPFGPSLPAVIPATLELDRLIAMFTDPARTLLQERLGLSLHAIDDALEDREPVMLDGLGSYQLGERVIGWLEAGRDRPTMLEEARARGLLPPGAPGEQALDAAIETATALTEGVPASAERSTRTIELDLEGVRLFGVVRDVARGALWDVRYSSLQKPKRNLRTWIRLLALAACHEDLRRAELVGRQGGEVKRAMLLVTEGPRELLRGLVSLYLRGLTRPLLSFPETSHAYAKDLGRPDKALAAALSAWNGNAFGRGEALDPWVQALFPDGPPFLDAEGRVVSSFVEVADQVWVPLLDAWATHSTRGRR
ncbi:MAG: exodeoxyribonuclease V subunit gamma [Myxococcales bacterium]|nr:exodeoxyribonuclease V subunit gamma [Myxococcales bacterium]